MVSKFKQIRIIIRHLVNPVFQLNYSNTLLHIFTYNIDISYTYLQQALSCRYVKQVGVFESNIKSKISSNNIPHAKQYIQPELKGTQRPRRTYKMQTSSPDPHMKLWLSIFLVILYFSQYLRIKPNIKRYEMKSHSEQRIICSSILRKVAFYWNTYSCLGVRSIYKRRLSLFLPDF